MAVGRQCWAGRRQGHRPRLIGCCVAKGALCDGWLRQGGHHGCSACLGCHLVLRGRRQVVRPRWTVATHVSKWQRLGCLTADCRPHRFTVKHSNCFLVKRIVALEKKNSRVERQSIPTLWANQLGSATNIAATYE